MARNPGSALRTRLVGASGPPDSVGDVSLKAHFSRALGAVPGRLHMASHRHHPWPDVTRPAHQQAWEDAAHLLNEKWDRVLGVVLPEAQEHIARRLSLPDPSRVAIAAHPDELLRRLLSRLRAGARVLATDGEPPVPRRPLDQLAADARLELERVPAEPLESLPDRFVEAAAAGRPDLVYLSHVLDASGYVVESLTGVVEAVPAGSRVLVDGTHGFMAVPTDLSPVADRVLYLGAGDRSAMAGENLGFLHCPPGWDLEPSGTVAPFDPAGMYRFNAVQRWLDELGLTVPAIHTSVRRLQHRLLKRLGSAGLPDLSAETLTPPGWGRRERAHFLSFATPRARELHERLHAVGVIADRCGDRLRLGLGIYHDTGDVEELVARLADAVPDDRERSEVRSR